MHTLQGNGKGREKKSDSPTSKGVTKPRKQSQKPALSIVQALQKYSAEELHTVWENLDQCKKSKFDTLAAIKWTVLHRTTDSEGEDRICRAVNRTAYGFGLKDSDRIRVTDLALLSKLHNMEGDDRQTYEDQLKAIGNGKKNTDLLGAHQCGMGRSPGANERDSAGTYCVEPNHIYPTTYGKNREHDHCHHFLHNDDSNVRQRFFKANLCTHDPPCF